MIKSNITLSPGIKGKREKKNLSVNNNIELIEFNIKIPTVYYDFFSAAIKLLEWDYDHVVDFFEEELLNSLISLMRCEGSLVLSETFLEKLENILEEFLLKKKEKK